MSSCCSVSSEENNHHFPKKRQCPVDGKEYKEVSKTTILHHIKSPWEWEEKNQGYYFCDNPDCDVVYFGEDSSVITQSELRTTVGVKSVSKNALICYCFGVNKADFIKKPELKNYVIEQTKESVCFCEIRNPSGKCCVKDFDEN